MPGYHELYRALKVSGVFEKVAAETSEFSEQEAAHCDALIDDLLKQAHVGGGLPSKEARVAKLAHAALELRKLHELGGEKVAASAERTAALMTKLATAAYVDAVLEEQMPKLSGEALFLTRNAQLLGREYAVSVLREMLGA